MGSPVVHFEIMGPDGAALARFYSELFGWQTQDMGQLGYHLVDTRAGGGINGGIGTSQDGRPRATFYVEASDPQEILDRVESMGGATVLPVNDLGMVTLALFSDPDGLVVGVVKADPEGAGGSQRPSPGEGAAVEWFEILGPEAGRTQRFYMDLFGWTDTSGGFPAYALIDTGVDGAIRGGIGAGGGSTWVAVYATVPEVEASLARAEKLGGRREYGPMKVNESTVTGAFRDPAGNVFGVYS